jgi:hypothetical protein
MSPATSRPWWTERDRVDHRPPAARGKGARRGFGTTWWGQAWVEALETRARLDLNRLPRGRGYARRGTVADLVIRPGSITARVQGSRARPYAVTVAVPTFTGVQWDRVLDAIAAQLGRAAALLDGELPPELAADVASTGLDLLPGAGEVRPRCSCPDYADPCKHSAAVCYLVADALDADPFALLLLRGRSREELVAGLRARRGGVGAGGPAARGRGAPAPDPRKAGVLAAAAYARQDLPALPAPPLPPARPGAAAVLPVDPPPGAGVTTADLATLAAGAAARAWALAHGEPDAPTSSTSPR